MNVPTTTPTPDARFRSDRDRRGIELAGGLLVAAVWLERQVARRLKASADRQP